MYNKYFNEDYVSEDELKLKICSRIQSLSRLNPDEFSSELLNFIDHQQDTSTFLQNLIKLIPIIQNIKKNFEIVTEVEALRIVVIAFDSYYYGKMLEQILLRLMDLAFANKFVAIRYLIAVEIIEKKLKEDLKYDRDLLFGELVNYRDLKDLKVYESLFAREEIARVSNNEEVSGYFWDSVEKFEASIENYIKQVLPNIVFEMYNRLFLEAVVTNLHLLDGLIGDNELITNKDKKDFLKFIY